MKVKFRGSYGLDASNEKVINVAKADFENLSDGVNVEFFIEENTVQNFDKERDYKKGFVVVYDNKIYKSLVNVKAGDFDRTEWVRIRVDDSWIRVDETSSSGQDLNFGEYIIANSKFNNLTFNLPKNKIDGESVIVRDTGFNTGEKPITINSVEPIILDGNEVRSIRITNPGQTIIFTYSRGYWYATKIDNSRRYYVNSSNSTALQSGDIVYRKTITGKIILDLPRYANNGDVITLFDVDRMNSRNHTLVRTHKDSGHTIGIEKTKELVSKTIGVGRLIFDATENNWVTWSGDLRGRVKIIRTNNYEMESNDTILVMGRKSSTAYTNTITLPTDIDNGDICRISLKYMMNNQTVVIKTKGNDKILKDNKVLEFPRRSEYPPSDTWNAVTELRFNNTNYTPFFELAYSEDEKLWYVNNIEQTIERVDANNRKRLGVAALATIEEARVDKDANPNKELIITPETLANRTALENRQGIARIATTKEVNQLSGSVYDDLTIVTPKKLNERAATETMRGLAEIATQTQANSSDEDTTIITPKKLHNRKASETLTGILSLVKVGGKAGTGRDTAGSGIYDFNNHILAVTPKTLKEFVSTQTALGSVYIASDAEVTAISQNPEIAGKPLVVTTQALDKKIAKEDRKGISQIARQTDVDAGTDDFKYITPKKLEGRIISEKLSGIVRIGTQVEFDAGVLDNVVSTPKKIKTFFNRTARTSVNSESGLVESGTLWTTHKLDIKQSMEDQRGSARLATQLETNAGVDDLTIVTPKKLHNKKATETTEGIVQIATTSVTQTGNSRITSVSPYSLKYVIQNSTSWGATEARRGPAKIASMTNAFTGNDLVGSTLSVDDYLHNETIVSPKGLNNALINFLPKMAQAEDSRNLGTYKAADYIRRNVNESISGIYTFSKQPVFNAGINAKGNSTLVNATITKLTSNDINIGGFNVSDSNGLTISKGVDNYLVIGDTIEINKNVNSKLVNAENYKINGFDIANITTTNNLSNKSKDTVINTKSKLFVDNGTKSEIVNEQNALTIGSRHFVRLTGDKMTGKLELSAPVSPVLPEMPETALPKEPQVGMWVSLIKVNIANYPRANVYGSDKLATTGTLTNFGASLDSITQIWAPTKANKKFIRSGDSSGWGQWDEIYTKNNRPTAEEVGAVSDESGRVESIIIRNHLQIGNLVIKPNVETRSVDFVWLDDPL